MSGQLYPYKYFLAHRFGPIPGDHRYATVVLLLQGVRPLLNYLKYVNFEQMS